MATGMLSAEALAGPARSMIIVDCMVRRVALAEQEPVSGCAVPPDTVTSDPDAGCIPMRSIPDGQGIASTPTVGSIERITANPTHSKSAIDRTLSYRIILLPVVKATQNYLKKVGSAPGLQEVKFSSSHTEATGDAYAALHRICPMGNIQLLAGPCRQFSPPGTSPENPGVSWIADKLPHPWPAFPPARPSRATRW